MSREGQTKGQTVYLIPSEKSKELIQNFGDVGGMKVAYYIKEELEKHHWYYTSRLGQQYWEEVIKKIRDAKSNT